MIKFRNKNKNKSTKNPLPLSPLCQSIIKKTDAKLTDILVHGVKLPGYEKFRQENRKKHRPRYLSTGCDQRVESAPSEQSPGLFKNTAIRTRLKSLQIQIAITHRKPQKSAIDRKYSFQKDVAVPIQDFLKTSTFSNQRSQKYISPHTELNWTNKSYKSKRHNIQQSVRCHSTKNKSDNPLWLSHNNHFNDLHLKKYKNTALHNNNKSLQNFNDSLLITKQEFWSLRISKPENPNLFQRSETDKQIDYFKNKANSRQPQPEANPKSKVCYSIKLRKDQKMRVSVTQPHNSESVTEFIPKLQQKLISDVN